MYGILGPKSVGGASAGLHLHVDDADAAIQRAIEAGATLVRPAADQFYGERSGLVRDPFGHEWSIGHEIEKVTPVSPGLPSARTTPPRPAAPARAPRRIRRRR